MEEIQLRVDKAYPIDLGKVIIRLDPTTLKKLQLSPDDIVEITGRKKTTATVWRADRHDWDQGLVRIDNFIRQNAGVSIGEKITIKKAEALEAKKLILALPESITQGGPELQFGEHANEIIKRYILKKPVFRGDIIPIINSMSQSMAESLTTSQVIPLVVVETDPSNTIVMISEKTIIELSQKSVKYPKKIAAEHLCKTVQFAEKKNESIFKSTMNYANQILKPCDLAVMRDDVTGEINLCETKDTFISATKNVQKKITFSPSVFEIPRKSNMPNCVSVMMPFSTEFDDVYGCINDACYEAGMSCHKADDFWHHSAIIQDIFELIFRSSIVIVDFTSKNPNVFYEAGIAHTLGKTVLPITQNGDDIPFDLRHHRYVLYHNDREGLKKLKRELVSKLNFEKGRE